MAVRRVQLPAQLQAVEDLLLWSNPAKSAVALGGCTLLWALLEVSAIPLLTWVSNLWLIAILACTLWALAARFLGSSGPGEHLPSALRTGLDEAVVRAAAERARQLLNRGLAHLNRLLSGEDLSGAAKAFAALWVIGSVGRFMTPVGLLYTTIVGLFTLPKVYEMRKDEIDGAVGRAREVAGQQFDTAKSKATELMQRLTPQKARPHTE